MNVLRLTSGRYLYNVSVLLGSSEAAWKNLITIQFSGMLD